MGDGGFTFNRSEEQEKIIGYKPFKKPKGGSLKPEEKILEHKVIQSLSCCWECNLRCEGLQNSGQCILSFSRGKGSNSREWYFDNMCRPGQPENQEESPLLYGSAAAPGEQDNPLQDYLIMKIEWKE